MDEDRVMIPQRGVNILLNGENSDDIQMVRIAEIQEFPGHPYPVREDEALTELMNSIKNNGQLEPAIIRKAESGYQMLSGHRRRLAMEKLGYADMRAIILSDITDNQAKAIMLDCNVRRDELRPSEKARIYYDKKLLYQSMPREEFEELADMFGAPNRRSATAFVAKRSEESEGQIKRYIRLHTRASPALKSMVDAGEMSLRIADELTALPAEAQDLVCSVLKDHSRRISYDQAVRLRQLEDITLDNVLAALGISVRKLTSDEPLRLSSKKIRSYFPDGYSAGQIQEVLYGLLDEWRQHCDSTP